MAEQTDLGIWQMGPNPDVEQMPAIHEMTREQAGTTEAAILAVHAAAPAHKPGRRWYHAPTGMRRISDGTRWDYDGGGGGETVSGGVIPVGLYRQPTRNARKPLRLWRDGDGMMHLSGTLENGVPMVGWSPLYTQFLMAQIAQANQGLLPATDTPATGMVHINAGGSITPVMFVLRGTNTETDYSANPAGSLVWVNIHSNAALDAAGQGVPGNIAWLLPDLVWKPGA